MYDRNICILDLSIEVCIEVCIKEHKYNLKQGLLKNQN
jgi:hypothetical protein